MDYSDLMIAVCYFGNESVMSREDIGHDHWIRRCEVPDRILYVRRRCECADAPS